MSMYFFTEGHGSLGSLVQSKIVQIVFSKQKSNSLLTLVNLTSRQLFVQPSDNGAPHILGVLLP